MKVTRLSLTQDAIQQHEARDDLVIDRTVYRKMSSLTDNKILQNPTGKDSKFDRFLLDMEDIHRGKLVDAEVSYLDQYLGNLGDGTEYPFIEDMYIVSPWLNENTQYAYRNVIDKMLDTDRNVIDRDTGSNVIHTTSDETRISRR